MDLLMQTVGSALIALFGLTAYMVFSLPADDSNVRISHRVVAYARHFGLRLLPYVVGIACGVAVAAYPIFGTLAVWSAGFITLCVAYSLWNLGPKTSAHEPEDGLDPIEEAEVYLRYGRRDEALVILTEGLKNHPERTDVQIRLSQLQSNGESSSSAT